MKPVKLRSVKERSVFRLSMIAAEPVYLMITIDGEHLDSIVDELGAGGARLISAKYFDDFYEGQILGPCILMLHDAGMPVVYPVVKWKQWPLIGVEFMDITEREREMIFRFLFKVQRKIIRSPRIQ